MDKQKYAIIENKTTTAKFDITNTVEGGGECTMPDYYPQIRKIVSCTLDTLPDSKFISGNTLEYGGTLSFNVLYIGDDGSLVCFPFATEYSGKESLCAEVRGTAEVAIDAKAEDIQCRVLAPRKLSLKARIKTRISAFDRVPLKMQMLGSGGEDVSMAERAAIQSLSRTIPTLYEGRGMTTGKTSGTFNERQGSKPISCSGSICITEAKCRKDAVILRGEACLTAVVFTADGFYSTASARFPFEEIVSSEGAMEGDAARGWGRVASVSLSEEDGGSLRAEIEYDIEAEWCRKQEISIVEDAYAAGRDSSCSFEPITSLIPLACVNSSLSVSGNGKRTTKPSPNEYLICMHCEPYIDRAEQKDKHIIFTGNCRIKSYIASNGEVICEEMNLPIKYESSTESPLNDGKIVLFANTCCIDIKGRLEGDSIYANAELFISALANRELKISPVSKITLEEEDQNLTQAAQIKVYYGDKNERLWDISKKYKVQIGKLEAANQLKRGDSIGGKPIIIPIGIG